MRHKLLTSLLAAGTIAFTAACGNATPTRTPATNQQAFTIERYEVYDNFKAKKIVEYAKLTARLEDPTQCKIIDEKLTDGNYELRVDNTIKVLAKEGFTANSLWGGGHHVVGNGVDALLSLGMDYITFKDVDPDEAKLLFLKGVMKEIMKNYCNLPQK